MSEPFIGEIRMFAGNFAPRGWALCDGQLLAINQNSALFSLLGTIYGGDGRTTFGLPDMRGRIPVHAGNGPGLSDRRLGTRGGQEGVTLNLKQLASHSHGWEVSSNAANQSSPQNRALAQATSTIYSSSEPNVSMNAAMVSNTGGGQSVPNMMPFLCVNFIVALLGIFPSRS